MTPRRMLRWGAADEFRTPRPDGLSLEQAAEKIDVDFGAALTQLRNMVAQVYGIPPGLMPLAWFPDPDGRPVCGPCRSLVTDLGTLFRCPDCGAVAAKPEGWMP